MPHGWARLVAPELLVHPDKLPPAPRPHTPTVDAPIAEPYKYLPAAARPVPCNVLALAHVKSPVPEMEHF